MCAKEVSEQGFLWNLDRGVGRFVDGAGHLGRGCRVQGGWSETGRVSVNRAIRMSYLFGPEPGTGVGTWRATAGEKLEEGRVCHMRTTSSHCSPPRKRANLAMQKLFFDPTTDRRPVAKVRLCQDLLCLNAGKNLRKTPNYSTVKVMREIRRGRSASPRSARSTRPSHLRTRWQPRRIVCEESATQLGHWAPTREQRPHDLSVADGCRPC